jgi:hypothetical protein
MKKRNKKGQFIKGIIPYFKGKKLPQDVRNKISETNKKKGIIPPNQTGFHHSNETKIKIGNASRGREKSLETIKRLSESHKGEKSYLWKGGRSPLVKLIKSSFKYRQWRSDIFTRDSFTCQNCLISGHEIHPHHIKSFSDILDEYKIKTLREALECEELWNINNGITLCRDCHKLTKSYGRNR